MRLYKRLIISFSAINIVSIIVSVILNYIFNEQYLSNLCIGIFTGALVTFFSSIFSYFHERRAALEDYYIYLSYMMDKISGYQDEWDLKKKARYYINISELDFSKNEILFGRIDLFNKDNQKYIHERLYMPLYEFRKEFKSCADHCKRYLEEKDVSDSTIEGIIQETENYFMKYKAYSVTGLDNVIFQSARNRFIDSTIEELDGRYTEIMYPNRKRVDK